MSEAVLPAGVLRHWRRLAGATSQRIESGLINRTWALSTAGAEAGFILQRLHPVFRAEVNRDIEAVTAHLDRSGVPTPRLVPCDDGRLWCEHDGHVWRLMSRIPGCTVHAVTGTVMAAEAGRMAAVFHTALGTFEHDYVAARGHVHDTRAHLQRLETTLARHAGHRLYDAVAPLAHHVLETVERFEVIDGLPRRHCHGDLKISNIVFDNGDRAVALIDLDTVNRMHWPLEMGDALRSWCNPRTEDQLRADLDLDILDAALQGYAAAAPGWLQPEEKRLLIPGLARICLELSARFLDDALRERYFGWDRRVYATRGDHNLARGRAMAALYDDVGAKRDLAEKIAARRLG